MQPGLGEPRLWRWSFNRHYRFHRAVATMVFVSAFLISWRKTHYIVSYLSVMPSALKNELHRINGWHIYYPIIWRLCVYTHNTLRMYYICMYVYYVMPWIIYVVCKWLALVCLMYIVLFMNDLWPSIRAQDEHTTSTRRAHDEHTTSTGRAHDEHTTSTRRAHNENKTSYYRKLQI